MKKNPYIFINENLTIEAITTSFNIKQSDAVREVKRTLCAFYGLSKLKKFAPFQWEILEKLLDPSKFSAPCARKEHTFLTWFLASTLRKQGEGPTNDALTVRELYPVYVRSCIFFGTQPEKIEDFSTFLEQYLPLFTGLKLVKIKGSRSPKKQFIQDGEVNPHSPFIVS